MRLSMTLTRTRLRALVTVGLGSALLVSLSALPAAATDTTEPNTTITSPTANGTVTSPVTVTGGATDDVGVTLVDAAVKDRISGLWWTGSTWQTAISWQTTTLTTPGATSTTWSWIFAPSGGSGSYSVTARAHDAAKNVDTTRPTVKFAIGTSPIPSYVSTLMGPGLADMTPVDVAATASTYYLIDVARYRIVAVDRTTGAVTATTSGSGRGSNDGDLAAARALALDASGNVYVADTPNARVTVYDSHLNYLRSFGTKGTGAGQFEQVYGIAVGIGKDASGNLTQVVYAVDGNGRIEKFSLSGTYISTLVSTGLNQPRMIEVAPNTNDVWVVNARNHQIGVYDVDGNPLFHFGSGGSGPSQFNGDPRGIAISPDGSRVYVSDQGNHRVQVFDGAGTYVTSLGGASNTQSYLVDSRGLATAPDGTLIVTDEWGFGLKEWSATGTFTRTLFGTPPPAGGVNSPRGIAVDPAGRIYISDWWNQRLQAVDPDGNNVLSWGFRGTRTEAGSINFAWDLVLQPGTNRLFLANRESHEIEVFTTTGQFVTRWGTRGTAPGQLQFPQGLAFDPTNGTLLEADSANNRIQRFSIDANGVGTLVAVYGGPGTQPGQFATPTGLAVAPDGTIWVADTRHSKIQKRDPSTGTWTSYTKPTAGGTNTPFNVPWGVTVAPDGNIWIADSGNNRIVAVTPSMSQVFVADGTALGSGPLSSPYKIAFGPNNRVYVSDTFNNRVIALQTSGS